MMYSWVNFDGNWVHNNNESIFHGSTKVIPVVDEENSSGAAVKRQKNRKKTQTVESSGFCVSNAHLSEGDIKVDVVFDQIQEHQTAEIMVQWVPATKSALHVGISGPTDALFSIRLWGDRASSTVASTPEQTAEGKPERGWTHLEWVGDPKDLKSNKIYKLLVRIRNTILQFLVDGVVVFSHDLGTTLGGFQVGLFAAGRSNIHFRNFEVTQMKPQAFVVMQFNTREYEDLFEEVIQPQCELAGLETFRATDTYSPGIVISDIAREIARSRVVIAEITPANPNVYYEVGYADALRKPVILIADRTLKDIPFDVRPYRIIFYENSIGGKKRVEDELSKYLSTILSAKA